MENSKRRCLYAGAKSKLLPCKKATIEGVLNDERDAMQQIFDIFDVDRGGDLDRNEAVEIIIYLRNLTNMETLSAAQLTEEIDAMQQQVATTPQHRHGADRKAVSPTRKDQSSKTVDFSQFYIWWKNRDQRGWSMPTAQNSLVQVSNKGIFEPFMYKNDHFPKTGSGQT